MSAKSALVSALAQSSAHGISRAAAARPLSLKIMWMLLFLAFLTLCCLSAWTLVEKVSNIYVDQSTEEDKVQFEFPDIYLCPSLIYSGSIPFNLTASEAKIVNDEVSRLSKLFDKLHCNQNVTSNYCMHLDARVVMIQQSLPVHIAKRFLLPSESQSFLLSPQLVYRTFTFSPHVPNVSVIIHPTNQLCYMVRVPEEEYDSLNYRRSCIFAWPFVDPHIEDIKYNGTQINPITVPSTNESIPFESWQVTEGYYGLQSLGFRLQVVPRGAYPSLMHDTKLGLAAGRSYNILIGMKEIVYSPELHGKYCEPRQEPAVFVSSVTEEQQVFKSSRASCFFSRISDMLEQKFHFLYPDYPKPWKLRHIPGVGNLTQLEMSNASSHEIVHAVKNINDFINNNSRDVDDYCRTRQPCEFKEYELTSDSLRWPRVGNSLAEMFRRMPSIPIFNSESSPATKQLINLANELLSGNHSTHTETLFRHTVEKSMIELRIWVKTPRSPRVTIAYSYSWVAFLADLGGLLGLYIGCSMLTFCELLELVYHLLVGFIAVKLAKRDQPETEDALPTGSKPAEETL